MLGALGSLIVKRRRLVMAFWMLFVIAAVVIGGSVTSRLVTDPGGIRGSESEAVTNALEDMGMADPSLVAAVVGLDVEDPATAETVTAATAAVQDIDGVDAAVDRYSVPLPQLTANDGQATLIAITINSDLTEAQTSAVIDEVEETLREIDAPRVIVGGAAMVQIEAVEQNESDLQRAELISMPLVLLVLFLIFGGLLAASLPLLVTVVAVPGTLLILRIAAEFTELSVFALNAATMLGLGLSVDYALLVVSRFRSERRDGFDVHESVVRTVASAGRTVLFSGLTVAVSLLGFLLFDNMIFTSIGIGGMGVVLLAMAAAITLVPAVLAALGHRISVPEPDTERAGLFGTVAHFVQRRAVPVAVAVTVVLVAMAAPFLGARLQIPGAEGLPASLETRELFDLRQDRFADGGADPVVVVAQGSVAALADLRMQVEQVPGVAFAGERPGSPDGTVVLDVIVDGESQGERAETVVGDLRSIETQADIQVGGAAAMLVDGKDQLFGRLPLALAVMALATLVLLFLLTGSVLIPIKAMVMNALSLTATFGVLVWGFQNGALAGVLDFETVGYLSLWAPFLIFFLAFGLSMDYEVFLLSRVAEIHDELVAEGHPHANDEAVRRGLTSTGRIITSAAALIAIVFLSFATASTVEIKALGVGLALAVVLDATVVRMLLVPATMKLLGEWNWWAPAPLRRFHQRFGLSESGAALSKRSAGEDRSDGGNPGGVEPDALPRVELVGAGR